MSSLVVADSTVGIAVISLVFIVGGYLLVGVLWYLMVRRPSRDERMRAERLARPQSRVEQPDGRHDADATIGRRADADDS